MTETPFEDLDEDDGSALTFAMSEDHLLALIGTKTPATPPFKREAGGHVMQNHVALSDEAVLQRMKEECVRIVSFFENHDEADRIILQALKANAETIEDWYDQAPEWGTLHFHYILPDPTGIIISNTDLVRTRGEILHLSICKKEFRGATYYLKAIRLHAGENWRRFPAISSIGSGEFGEDWYLDGETDDQLIAVLCWNRDTAFRRALCTEICELLVLSDAEIETLTRSLIAFDFTGFLRSGHNTPRKFWTQVLSSVQQTLPEPEPTSVPKPPNATPKSRRSWLMRLKSRFK